MLPGLIPSLMGDGAAQQQITRSLRFSAGRTMYMFKSLTVTGERRVLAVSDWIKRSAINGFAYTIFSSFYDANNFVHFYIASDETLTLAVVHGGVIEVNKITTLVLRDPSAWMHVCFSIDTRPAAPVVTMEINGVAVTSFSTNTNILPQNDLLPMNFPGVNNFVGLFGGGSTPFSGYMANLDIVDGTAATASSFGLFDATGLWVPKPYAGAYGVNGARLTFSDNSSAATLGIDYSGFGNNYTPTNFSVSAGGGNDSLLDTPTNYGADTGLGGEVRGNYCVLDALNKNPNLVIGNGNLTLSGSSSSHNIIYGTIGMLTGKWYWEVTVSGMGSTLGGPPVNILGVQNNINFADGVYVGSAGVGIGWGYNAGNGGYYASGVTPSGTAPPLQNGTMGVACDADLGAVWFRNSNGTWHQGNPATGTSPSGTWAATTAPMHAAVSLGLNVGVGTWEFNFGQRPFAFAAPAGFKCLCAQNLPDPAVRKPVQHFDIHVRSGNSSPRNIIGKAFQPDMVWIKNRTGTPTDHALYDSVRGVQKELVPNAQTIETTEPTGLTSFNADGFTLGVLPKLNALGSTFVDWFWKKGAAPGVDIVTVPVSSNAPVNHSLGVKPALLFIKSRTVGTHNWSLTHRSFAAMNDYFLRLNTSDQVQNVAGVWGGEPTSTQFFAGSGILTTGESYVAYLFAQVPGFSRIGSYTGNGATGGAAFTANSYGPFVWCGFKPRFVMCKRYDAAGNWVMFDAARDPINPVIRALQSNVNAAEVQNGISGFNVAIDFVSNGFKLREASVNTAGAIYAYAAFAETPFKFSRAR